MSPIEHQVVAFLADEYSSPTAARTLWERAGGRARDVSHSIERPRDLWQSLWNSANRGAHATPIAIVRAALEDNPKSAILLAYLRSLATPQEASIAADIVAKLEALPHPAAPAQVAEIIQPLQADPDRSFVLIAPALENRVLPERRPELQEALTQVAAGASSKVVESVAKGVTGAFLAAWGLG